MAHLGMCDRGYSMWHRYGCVIEVTVCGTFMDVIEVTVCDIETMVALTH